jgi:hypothetical protein
MHHFIQVHMAWPGERCHRVVECLGCQKSKVHHHVQLRPQHITVLVQLFSHIHVDLVGMLPASEGATYVFTGIGRNTR